MTWLTISLELLRKTYLLVIGFFGLFLMKKNSKLAVENNELQHRIKEQTKVNQTQSKVINAMRHSKNNRATLKYNIERMRKNKL